MQERIRYRQNEYADRQLARRQNQGVRADALDTGQDSQAQISGGEAQHEHREQPDDRNDVVTHRPAVAKDPPGATDRVQQEERHRPHDAPHERRFRNHEGASHRKNQIVGVLRPGLCRVEAADRVHQRHQRPGRLLTGGRLQSRRRQPPFQGCSEGDVGTAEPQTRGVELRQTDRYRVGTRNDPRQPHRSNLAGDREPPLAGGVGNAHKNPGNVGGNAGNRGSHAGGGGVVAARCDRKDPGARREGLQPGGIGIDPGQVQHKKHRRRDRVRSVQIRVETVPDLLIRRFHRDHPERCVCLYGGDSVVYCVRRDRGL